MNPPPVKALLQLLRTSLCPAGPGLEPLLTGLAHPLTDQRGWTLSKRLLTLRQPLSSDEEAVAALLATDPAIGDPWLAVMAARTREAGKLSNPEALVQLISQLGAAAPRVEQALPAASLAPTSLADLERQLLGSTVEQNQTLPVLTRVLATAAQMSRWQESQSALPPLAPIDRSGQQPQVNWCRGRLLCLPAIALKTAPGVHATVLPGHFYLVEHSHQERLSHIATSPWLFLCAAIAYTQDSWAAEQRGGLLLELPMGQQPSHPGDVQVLVEDAEGYEVLCGTLGELVMRIIDALDMAFFPYTPSVAELNNRLSPVIHQLLTLRLWHYSDGLYGEQGYYCIDPDFADDCYRITGSKIFGRRARSLIQTIRLLAEQWRQERQLRPQQNRNHDNRNRSLAR